FTTLIPGVTLAQSGIRNNYAETEAIKKLKIERQMIYVPSQTWMYSHHPCITFFKQKLIAAWSNGMVDEDKPG
ncbi:MAG: hypothetical protein ABJA78_20100, partial [Ferruginibacter sp.]